MFKTSKSCFIFLPLCFELVCLMKALQNMLEFLVYKVGCKITYFCNVIIIPAFLIGLCKRTDFRDWRQKDSSSTKAFRSCEFLWSVLSFSVIFYVQKIQQKTQRTIGPAGNEALCTEADFCYLSSLYSVPEDVRARTGLILCQIQFGCFGRLALCWFKQIVYYSVFTCTTYSDTAVGWKINYSAENHHNIVFVTLGFDMLPLDLDLPL